MAPAARPVLVLDSASLYYRSFYALPEKMTAPDGRPHNAVRGFLSTLTRLVEVPCEPRWLNSADCFALCVPFNTAQNKGIVYMWAGASSVADDYRLLQELTQAQWPSFAQQKVGRLCAHLRGSCE